jgi:hypothetical protein
MGGRERGVANEINSIVPVPLAAQILKEKG